MNGTSVLVYIEGVCVGHQRDVTFDETSESIDMSSKEQRARRVDPGRYSSTVTLDHLYVPTDTAYLSLKNAMRNGTKVTLMRNEEGADLEQAEAVVTSLSESAPDQGEAVVSVGFDIDGDWVEVS